MQLSVEVRKLLINDLRTGNFKVKERLVNGELEIFATADVCGYEEPEMYIVLVGLDDVDLYDDDIRTAHVVTIGEHVFEEYYDEDDGSSRWGYKGGIVDSDLSRELSNAVGVIEVMDENFDRWFAAQFHGIDDVLNALPETQYYDYADTLCFYVPPTEEEMQEDDLAWDEFIPDGARMISREEAAQMILDRKFGMKTPD